MDNKDRSYKMNVQGVNVPLIAFNTIFDTDFGLMLLIDRKFLDSSIFNIDFFNNHHTIKAMVQALVIRDEINPLSICFKDPSKKDVMNSLYNEFMDTHYSEILELSMLTGMAEFIKMTELVTSDVKASIVCTKQSEIDMCRKHIGEKIPIYLLDEISSDFLNYSQQFIFKYMHDEYSETLVPKITDKTIYYARYNFNYLDSENPDPIALQAVKNYNQLSMIEIYSSEKLFDNKEEQQ